MKRGLRLVMGQYGRLRVARPALTIERPAIGRAPRQGARPNRLPVETIEGAAPGTVLVMSTDPVAEAALWGGLLAAAAAARGTGGVVCDGPVRDPDEIVAVGCPTFATGAVPAGSASILTLGAIRYVLQISVPFTEEAARYFGVSLVFMGGAALVATEGHIRLTFLLERVGGLWHEVLVAFSALLVLIFNGIILIGGIQLARLNWNQSATTLPVTVGVLYIAVALGAACSIVFALHRLKSRLAERS